MVELTQDQVLWRAKWVRALISDDYEQGRSALAVATANAEGTIMSTAYCCLGVATVLVDPNSPRLGFSIDTTFGSGTFESKEGTMDDATREVFGLSEEDQETAYTWNDDEHMTFLEIARAVAWATKERIPLFPVTHVHFAPEDEFEEDPIEPRTPPEDFDVEAWLAEVES